MAATRDLESSSEKTVKAVMSFFLATESGQTSSQQLHKEKFNVPISKMITRSSELYGTRGHRS